MPITILSRGQGGSSNKFMGLGNPKGIASTSATIGLDDTYILAGNISTITLALPDPSICIGKELNVTNRNIGAIVSSVANIVPVDGGVEDTEILPGIVGAWCRMVSDGTFWNIIAIGGIV